MQLTFWPHSTRCVFLNVFILTFLVFFGFQKSFSSTYTSVGSGNWDADATWSGTGIPGAGDTVIIEGNYIVTVNMLNAACNKLDIGTSNGNGTLAFVSSAELTVNDKTTIGSLSNPGFIDMSNGGVFTTGSWVLGNTGASIFTYGTGTIKFTTTFTLPTAASFNSFYNLEIISGTTILGATTNVYGNLTMSNTGILDANGNDLIVKGNWTQSGTASFAAGVGTVTLDGSTDQFINHTGIETFANLVVDKSAGRLVLNTGSVFITNLLMITSGTVDLGTNTLSGPGNLTISNGDLQIAELTSICNCTLPRLTGVYNISGGALTFKGEGEQTIRGGTVSIPIVPTYNDLLVRGSGTKTLEGDIDINGSLSILDSAELDVSVSNRTVLLAGDWINTSTYAMPDAFNERSGNVIVDGSGSVSLTSTTVVEGETFYDLTMIKSGGEDNLTLNNEMVITHELTLSVGHIISSPVSRNLTIEVTAIPVAGGNNDSFVDGPVIKKTASTIPYVLPTGKISPNNEYHWIEITPSGITPTTYVAEYFYTIPSNNTDVGAGVNRVSELEQWTLQRLSGNENAKVELSWTVNSIVNTNTTDLLIVQDDGTPGPRWINKCTCTTSGTLTDGSIQTTADITLFGSQYPLSFASPHVTNNELGNSRYSVADGNWDNSAIWATRSGGPAGASVPNDTKRVIIEAGKRVNVNVAAEALKLTLGNNGNGTLDFNATTNDVIVGAEGLIINSNSDVEGTNVAAVLRTTGDIVLNSDISVESADGVTPSNYILLRETTANKIVSGVGTVTNFTNNATTILIGSLTVKQSLSIANALRNAGKLILKGTLSQMTTNQLDLETFIPNTIEYDNTIPNFDFTLKGATYYNLTLSGASIKQPSLALNINGNLTLNSGAVLDQETHDQDIVIKGNWENLGGSFIPSTSGATEVMFNGTAEQTIVSGGSTFGNVVIDNSFATGVVLLDEMSIGSGRKLTLTDGYVFLGNNSLVLKGNNVNIGTPSSSSFIVTNGNGTLAIEEITSSRTFPVGSQGAILDYTPVTLDNTGGISDRYDVRVCNNIYYDGNCSGGTLITTLTINKTWNVSESVAGGSSVDLTLQWNALHELPSFDRSASFISHYTGGTWVQQQVTGAASGSGPYTKTVTNLTGSFSPYGVGSAGSPLPIELLNFNAVFNGDVVAIDWTTASEKNNNSFVAERTADGHSFTAVATVKGAGNSDELLHYSTVDPHPLPGTTYYRLKQIDFDGTYSYSHLATVNYETTKKEPVFFLYPNPASDKTLLSFYNIDEGQELVVKVYDISGKIIYSQTAKQEKGEGNKIINLSENIPQGIYLLVANTGNYVWKQKLIVNR